MLYLLYTVVNFACIDLMIQISASLSVSAFVNESGTCRWLRLFTVESNFIFNSVIVQLISVLCCVVMSSSLPWCS